MRVGITNRSAPHRYLAPTDGVGVYKTAILVSPPDEFPAPTASLFEQAPGDVIRTHFHFNSQFQVFVHGGGTLGRTAIGPIVVQYAAPHTGYGPITAGEEGIWYLTLRPSFPLKQPGFQPVMYLPESRPLLDASLKKFQVHSDAIDCAAAAPAALEISEVIAPAGDGLGVWRMRLPPSETARAPRHPRGLARYWLVAAGSLLHEGKLLPALSLIWTVGEEDIALEAGGEGADVIVMQFPHHAF